MTPRVFLLGLDPPEIEELRARVPEALMIAWEYLPRWSLEEGVLRVESKSGSRMLRVDAVVFHGIFEVEEDFDLLTALALWGGPCLPSARGLLDARLRLPCLARAVHVSRYGLAPRGLVRGGEPVSVSVPSVAKWGNWHCGENKERFETGITPPEIAVIEPWFDGAAVRVVLLGERAWQIRLEGPGWKKSIHDEAAAFMPLDPELEADARALANHFDLELTGIDYIVGAHGQTHLLELNHVPNVTRFPEIRDAFLEHVVGWWRGLLTE